MEKQMAKWGARHESVHKVTFYIISKGFLGGLRVSISHGNRRGKGKVGVGI